MSKEKRVVFFEGKSWYHRTKELQDDLTTKYGKKGGFETPEEAEKSYWEYEKRYQKKQRDLQIAKMQKTDVMLGDYLEYWFENIFSPRIETTTRMVGAYTLYNLILPSMEADIKLRYVSVEYLDALLERVAKICPSAGNKGRELLNIAMKDAAGDKFISYNPMPETKPYPRAKPKVRVLGKEKLKVFLEAASKNPWYLEILLGLFCGLRKGEILGIAGLDGSGRTETLETIFGIATRKSGTIKLDGKQVSNKNAQDSIKNGFALLTEERRATGIFGILNIRENTVISSLKRHKKGFYLSEKSMKEDTQKYIDALRTKTPSQETKIRALSGGNQQKVILGRWLLTDPEVLLLDEPTRGIDVGAKYEIYQLIIDLANRGKVVIVVSSEMPELLGICDRIMVMSGGRLAGEIDAEEATQELIMTYAAKYV